MAGGFHPKRRATRIAADVEPKRALGAGSHGGHKGGKITGVEQERAVSSWCLMSLMCFELDFYFFFQTSFAYHKAAPTKNKQGHPTKLI